MLGPSEVEFNRNLKSVPQVPLFRQVSKDVSYQNQQLGEEIFTERKGVNLLMIGTGEYTTGFVHGSASDSDKKAGVVALTMFDLRHRFKINRLGLCGVNGQKFPEIRSHMRRMIEEVYEGLSTEVETYPSDYEVDPRAYIDALNSFHPGDAVTIFTPDNTHFEIAMEAVKRGLHVLVTKPVVQTLEQHLELLEEANKRNVLVAVEVHKRWDPMYSDARDRIVGLGPFSYMYSYMSQPKHQLTTFSNWVGKSSDISYYLNSHHIDFHEWAMGCSSRPISVMANSSIGIAKSINGIECEDTITLMVQWENFDSLSSCGTAVYTSSWIAPKSDVHSQQRFFYMGQKGEVNIDQAHRGYSMADDTSGYYSINPLFMKYVPTNGKFSGQNGYGYRSFEAFVDAVAAINNGESQLSKFDHALATLSTTIRTTAILEAGRKSLDSKKSVCIVYDDPTDRCRPTSLKIVD